MDETTIKKQREIGKQLFLIDIIHHENNKARNGGFSTLSRDDLAKWASMTNNELDRFIGLCSALDPHKILIEIARSSGNNAPSESETEVFTKLKRIVGDALSEGYDWDVITSMTGNLINKDNYKSI